MALVKLGEAIEAARRKYQRERFDLMVKAGKELREKREAKKLTLRGMAKLLDVSAPFLHDVEHGRRHLSSDKADKAEQILTMDLPNSEWPR